jgi:hypothetical protein
MRWLKIRSQLRRLRAFGAILVCLGLGWAWGSSRFYRHGASGSGSGTGGLVTPPSPRSLSADSNRPRQQRRRTGSRGRSSSRGEVRGGTDRVRAELEVIDRGAESESSTTSSTHPSLGRPYTPSLPDDPSGAEADPDTDADSAWKASTDSNPHSLSSKEEGGGVHQLETPESSVHRTPVTSSLGSLGWTESSVTDSLASSIIKGESEDVSMGATTKQSPHYDPVRAFSLSLSFDRRSDMFGHHSK